MKNKLTIFSLLIVGALPAQSETSDVLEKDSNRPFLNTKRLLLLLDCSAAMKRPQYKNGPAQYDLAKAVVDQILEATPKDRTIGLRIFGESVQTSNPSRDCRDSALLAPMMPAVSNRGLIRDYLSHLQPTGFSCLGYAITKATDDVTATQLPTTVVLITGEQDSCGARSSDIWPVDLRMSKAKMVVFSTSTMDRTRSDLIDTQKIVQETGGKYYDSASFRAFVSDLADFAKN